MLNGNKVTVKVVCANDGTEQTARARTSGKQISVFYTCSTPQDRLSGQLGNATWKCYMTLLICAFLLGNAI
jgi:hypothetical protein